MTANIVFDGRTLGDHYPGIGRYAFGVWQALQPHLKTTLIDPYLTNTRFALTSRAQNYSGVRSLLSQLTIPRSLSKTDRYYAPYWLFPFGVPCPSVVTLYDATPLFGNDMSAPSKLIFRLAHRLAGRIAQRIIVLSESARREMLALGVPQTKIVVCPPGFDPKFKPANLAAIHQVRHKYQLPEEFWLCFGSKRWHKNTLAAVKAAQGRPLVVVGSYDASALQKQALSQLWASQTDQPIQSFSPPTQVVPFVAENDLPALYSAAKGLIFPSLREGFGLPIIEALACGTPVACLPVPGVREAAGDAASLADAPTTEALTEVIRQLDDPHFRQSKREAGLAWAQTFTWAQTTAAILSI